MSVRRASPFVCRAEDVPRLLQALESVPVPEREPPESLTVRELFSHPDVIAKCVELRSRGLRIGEVVDVLRQIGIAGSAYQIKTGVQHALKLSRSKSGRPKRGSKVASGVQLRVSDGGSKVGSDSEVSPRKRSARGVSADAATITVPPKASSGAVSRTVRPPAPVNSSRIPVATSVALRDRDL